MPKKGGGGQEEKFSPWLLSQVCTAGQSQHEVGVNVRLSVLESYLNYQTQPTLIRCRTGTTDEVYRQLKALVS